VHHPRWTRWLGDDRVATLGVFLIVGLFAIGAARPLIAASLIGFVLLALSSPRSAGAVLISYVVFVPASLYGLAPGMLERPYDLYYMGTAQLGVSIVELAISALALVIVLRRVTGALPLQRTWFPVWPSLAFTAVYLGQFSLALARGIGPMAAANYYSCRLLFDSLLVAICVIWLVRDEDRQRTMQLLVACITVRAVYGLGRLAFFGGDPQNYYANFQHTDIAMSFWDPADGAFMTLAALYSIGCLSAQRARSILSRPMWLGLALLASACIALTYRRSLVLGFGVALAALFVLRGLWKKPGWLLVPIVAVLVGVRGLLLRFATSSLFGVLSADSINHSGDLSGSRFLESASAWTSVSHHLLLGRGLTGAYDPLPGFSPFAYTTIVHNTVLFIWLKLGVFGVAAVTWLFLSVVWHALRARKRLRSDLERLLLIDALLASLVVWLVDALFGTPLIDHRHVLAIGLWMGMILVACRQPGGHAPDAVP